MNKAYQKITELSTKATLFSGISMLLEWDQETYMPKGAIEIRSKQVELIASLGHQERTSKDFANALSALIDIETGTLKSDELTDPQIAALREWRRDYIKAVKLPLSFVEEFAIVTSAATHAWADAKEKNRFKDFQPHLEKIVALCRKKADILGYEDHPYDALVDNFEPTMTTAVLTVLLERLKIPLTNLLKKICTKPIPDSSFLQHDFDHNKQLAFGKKLLSAMGFDKRFSRLDESAHPMCIPMQTYDTRMTTRINLNHPLMNILSCVHEGGHGLYHANLPHENYGTPLGEAASLGIDESQSRSWETIIGRSLPFWQHFFPHLKETFPEHLASVRLEDFYKAINTVKPTMIRTESDEVTYNLHIMLRFEMEKGLIEGTIPVERVPEEWNKRMREYLGITPHSDIEGCLQDIHWSLGAIGYFPTYTLGNLYAAQFFETFAAKHPNWKEQIAKGELSVLSNWQKEHIHRYGRQYLPEDLCEKITGKPLSEKPFITYLEKKYTPLYHLA